MLIYLHAVDFVVIHELFEVVQVIPPLEEEGLCDEAEPGCDLHFFALCLLQHLLKLLLAHIAVGFDLIGVWTQIHILQKDKKEMLSIIYTDGPDILILRQLLSRTVLPSA